MVLERLLRERPRAVRALHQGPLVGRGGRRVVRTELGGDAAGRPAAGRRLELRGRRLALRGLRLALRDLEMQRLKKMRAFATRRRSPVSLEL